MLGHKPTSDQRQTVENNACFCWRTVLWRSQMIHIYFIYFHTWNTLLIFYCFPLHSVTDQAGANPRSGQVRRGLNLDRWAVHHRDTSRDKQLLTHSVWEDIKRLYRKIIRLSWESNLWCFCCKARVQPTHLLSHYATSSSIYTFTVAVIWHSCCILHTFVFDDMEKWIRMSCCF